MPVSTSKPQYLTARQVVTQNASPITWLIPDRLVAPGLNLLAGEVSSGKTLLALDLALGVSSRGLAWGGLETPRGRVLYLSLDNSPKAISHRLQSLCRGYNIEPPDDLHFDFNLHNLADPAEQDHLKDRLHAHGYSLVIFDILVRYLPGLDENNVSAIGPILTALHQLTVEDHAAILLLHHLNKSAFSSANITMRIRGSSDILASVDTALSLTVRAPTRLLTQVKNSLGGATELISFIINNAAQNGELLDFTPRDEEQDSPLATTLVDITLDLFIRILKAQHNTFLRRDVLESFLQDFGQTPGQRTIDQAFSHLSEVEGVRAEFKGHYKYFGWFGEVEEEEEPQNDLTHLEEVIRQALIKRKITRPS